MLDAKCKDKGVRKVIVEMLDACGEITEALRSALVTVEGSANTFGDAQLSVDVIADEIMWEVAKGSEVVAYGASEELCGNQPVRRVHRQFFTKSFLGDGAAVLARSSGEEPASPRHRAGVASMAWRTTR